MLRESIGFTQKQVAEAIGLHRPTISEIEAGRRDVTSAELYEFARLYVTSLGDLLSDPKPTEDQAIAVLFRKPSLSTSGAKSALKRFMDRCRAERELESLLEIPAPLDLRPSYELPPPTDKWNAIQQGEEVARLERIRLEVGEEPLRNPLDLLEQQGVRIAPLSDDDGADVDGIYFETEELGACIAVNLRRDDRTGFRAAFTAGHEYAHWLLRDVMVEDFDFRTSPSDDFREVRANAFAAALLMPARGIRTYFRNLGLSKNGQIHQLSSGDIIRAMDYFGVSRQALLYRLQNLELLSAEKASEIRNVPLSFANIQQIAFDSGLALRRHEYRSTRLTSLTIEAWRRGLVGTGRAADLLELDISAFRALMSEMGEIQEVTEDDFLVGAAAAG